MKLFLQVQKNEFKNDKTYLANYTSQIIFD